MDVQIARSRRDLLDGRLGLKLRALVSLRAVAPADKTLLMALEREVDALQMERRELDNWIDQAETWTAHVGRWKATVSIPEVSAMSVNRTWHELDFNGSAES